jgi:hypothetical protein
MYYRFAVLDPTIKDLEKKHMTEIVMGPVVFDDFVLEQENIFNRVVLNHKISVKSS